MGAAVMPTRALASPTVRIRIQAGLLLLATFAAAVLPFAIGEHWSGQPVTDKATPYALALPFDGPFILVAAAAFIVALMVNPARQDVIIAAIDDVLGMDRWASRYLSRRADFASNVLVTLAVSSPALLLFRAGHGRQWAVLIDLVVIYLAVLANAAVSETVKVWVRRPRPFHYNVNTDVGLKARRSAFLSFYSAHTANAYTVTTAVGFTFSHLYPHSPWQWAVWAGGALVSAAVGVNRVAAGKHWPTDVLMGAVAGSTWGLVIPWLHVKSRILGFVG